MLLQVHPAASFPYSQDLAFFDSQMLDLEKQTSGWCQPLLIWAKYAELEKLMG